MLLLLLLKREKNTAYDMDGKRFSLDFFCYCFVLLLQKCNGAIPLDYSLGPGKVPARQNGSRRPGQNMKNCCVIVPFI